MHDTIREGGLSVESVVLHCFLMAIHPFEFTDIMKLLKIKPLFDMFLYLKLEKKHRRNHLWVSSLRSAPNGGETWWGVPEK
jgi:hypothetical protein